MTAPDGNGYCVDCVGDTDGAHFCRQCLQRVPGSGNGHCYECNAKHRMNRRAALLGAQFESAQYRALFAQFAQWRVTQVGAVIAVKTIGKESAALGLLERSVGLLSTDVTASQLLAVMSPEEWRKATTVQGFLAQQFDIRFDAATKLERSEADRIDRKVAEAEALPHGALLKRYRIYLRDAQPAIKVRTQRLYIAVADKFLSAIKVSASEEIRDNEKVAWVLRQHPSMYTSLSRFATWCNKHGDTVLVLSKPAPRTSDAARSTRLKERLRVALEQVNSPRSRSARVGAIVFVLCKLYGLQQHDVLSLKRSQLSATANAGMLKVNGTDIALDRRITNALVELGDLLSPNDYLFPGRVFGHPLVDAPRFG